MRRQRPYLLTHGANLASLLSLMLLISPSAQNLLARQSAKSQSTNAQAFTDSRVSVLFTALGKDKKFVTTLKAEDLSVTADGSEREILALKRQTDLPLFLAVAIDTSESQQTVLPKTKLAADVFLKGMMLPGTDNAAVLTFARDVTLEQEMTADISKVREAVARVKIDAMSAYVGSVILGKSGSVPMSPLATGVWDAVWTISNEIMLRSLGTGRRVLLIITDGVDTNSRIKLDEAASAAIESEVVVYAIGIGDSDNFDGVDKSPLRKLAEQTGGRAFFPKKIKELPAIFTQIQEEILSQYVVTFAPVSVARDGTFHKIKIEIKNPQLRGQQIKLAFPQGYFAGNSTPSVKR
jgi:Ca-activated chloride channel homolog